MKAGRHELTAELERGDDPTVYYRKVNDRTVFSSPVAECVDYTVFAGSADEIIASYRKVTGEVPMLPSWAFGYIHCRERFHTQAELLATARRFREEQIPIDLIVQDWQYWGKYGWNAMRFDEDASSFYWSNFRDRRLKPYGIDAWWQDATEPENDDLEGRKIMKNTVPGELFRNAYPLMVSKTIYEGLGKDDPERRPMIFTRSGFSGAQRY